MKTFIMGVVLALTAVMGHAKAIKQTQVGAGTVVLFNEQRHCEKDQLYFELQTPSRVIKGCWKLVEYQGSVVVLVKDEDGDGGFLLPQDFEDVKSL